MALKAVRRRSLFFLEELNNDNNHRNYGKKKFGTFCTQNVGATIPFI